MTATQPYGAEDWSTLRACWLDLAQPRFQSPERTRERVALRQRHDSALDALTAAGRLEPGVAEAVHGAFAEALSHIGMHGALCYAAMPFQTAPRQDLIAQAEALAGMAQFQAGRQPGELEEIRATPAEVEAARLLVEVLLTGRRTT
jgi:hypothetical protein